MADGPCIGYKRLRSRSTSLRVEGSSYINKNSSTTYGFVNVFLYLGKHFYFGRHSINIAFGPEIALPISAVIKVDEESTTKIKKPDFDCRLRLDVKWQYENIGIMGGYVLGIMDYQVLFGFRDRSKYSIYSNVIRLGLFIGFRYILKRGRNSEVSIFSCSDLYPHIPVAFINNIK